MKFSWSVAHHRSAELLLRTTHANGCEVARFVSRRRGEVGHIKMCNAIHPNYTGSPQKPHEPWYLVGYTSDMILTAAGQTMLGYLPHIRNWYESWFGRIRFLFQSLVINFQ